MFTAKKNNYEYFSDLNFISQTIVLCSFFMKEDLKLKL